MTGTEQEKDIFSKLNDYSNCLMKNGIKITIEHTTQPSNDPEYCCNITV